MRSLVRLVLVAAVAAGTLSKPALAQGPFDAGQRGTGWYFQGGVYLHYSDDEDYEGPPLFAGAEYTASPKWLYGFSMFQNSFGQFSQYGYVGRVFRPLDSQPYLHVKITGGIIHGYAGEHHDTLPVRWGDSWGIGVIPTIGYKKGRLGFDVAFLKASAALFLVGYEF